MLDAILPMFPGALKHILQQLPPDVQAALEEVRIREARALEIGYSSGYAFVQANGGLTWKPDEAYSPGPEECMALLELVTNHSVYTFEEELRRGYITIAGGHRVGLAGRTVLEQGSVKQIRNVSSFNIRIAREMRGTGKPVLPHLVDAAIRSVHHTLIISPPQQGKTTLIRDLARLISSGEWPQPQGGAAGLRDRERPSGRKVGIVDERSELAACVKGVPRFDLGPRTDVMDGCPKAEGMMMMIRSMSPEVLVVDEIGRVEDAAAIREAMHAGIRVIATAHGAGIEDAAARPVLKELMEEGVFSRYVLLDRRTHGKAGFRVYDGMLRPLQTAYSVR